MSHDAISFVDFNSSTPTQRTCIPGDIDRFAKNGKNESRDETHDGGPEVWLPDVDPLDCGGTFPPGSGSPS